MTPNRVSAPARTHCNPPTHGHLPPGMIPAWRPPAKRHNLQPTTQQPPSGASAAARTQQLQACPFTNEHQPLPSPHQQTAGPTKSSAPSCSTSRQRALSVACTGETKHMRAHARSSVRHHYGSSTPLPPPLATTDRSMSHLMTSTRGCAATAAARRRRACTAGLACRQQRRNGQAWGKHAAAMVDTPDAAGPVCVLCMQLASPTRCAAAPGCDSAAVNDPPPLQSRKTDSWGSPNSQVSEPPHQRHTRQHTTTSTSAPQTTHISVHIHSVGHQGRHTPVPASCS